MSNDDVLTRLTTSLADRYHVDRELGAGGMATVFRAHDLRHDAIKVLQRKSDITADITADIGADTKAVIEAGVTAENAVPL